MTLATGTKVVRLDPTDFSDRFQRLRAQLDVTAFGINLIRLAPGQSGRIHCHTRQEEVYIVLAGELTLLLDGQPQTFTRWEAVRVAPDVRRQLVNRALEPLVLLAIGGAQPHEGRDGVAFCDWDDSLGKPPDEVPLPKDEPVGRPPD